jgi:16S rRNA (uracil1498-N3)-methyltransferase
VSVRRFYVAPPGLEGEIVAFGPRESRHIATVLRLRPGARLWAFDGRQEVEVELVALGEAVRARVVGPRRPAVREVAISLLQGLPRGPKMDLIVRVATEVGITTIWPVVTARSLPPPGAARAARWTRVAREAARQCGRADPPEVRPAQSLEAALAALGPVDLFVVPWEEETRPIGAAIAGVAFEAAAVLIGPEGGLAAEDVAAARAAGGQTVSLGPRLLRTETAGAVCAAILLYERQLRPQQSSLHFHAR